MVAHPVTGDVEPRRHPHVAVTPHVVEEPLQRRRPPRPAGQAAVQPDRQHAPAPLRTLAVEDIKAVLEVLEEMLARVEALRGGEAHVVDVEGVGHDQLLAAADKLPVGQLVRIGVGKIQEPAFGRPDRERVGRGTSLVEPERPGAGDRRVKSDRLVDVGSLLLERVVPVVDPTQAVAGDLPARLVHGRDRLGVSSHRVGDAVDRHRQGPGREHPPQAPEAHPGAVFVDRLHVDVPLARPGLGAHDLRQEGLGGGVPVQDVVLCAFLIVDDELHGASRALRPGRPRRRAPVAHHVAWVGLVEIEHRLNFPGRWKSSRARPRAGRGSASPGPRCRSVAERRQGRTARAGPRLAP